MDGARHDKYFLFMAYLSEHSSSLPLKSFFKAEGLTNPSRALQHC
jgi:hypothetical protein